jgi:hypothetical protein
MLWSPFFCGVMSDQRGPGVGARGLARPSVDSLRTQPQTRSEKGERPVEGDGRRFVGPAACVGPLDREVAADLAEAYLDRWQAGHAPADRQAATHHARRGLEPDPSWRRGCALLNELDPPRPSGEISPAGWLALALVLGLVLFGLFLALRPGAPTSVRSSAAKA